MILLKNIGQTNTSFDDPIALLAACHQKILQQCRTLQNMLQHQQNNGSSDELVRAAQGVLRYFQNAAPLHHQDEEQDLFPHLQTHRSQQALLHELLQQHQQLDALVPKLLTMLQQIIQQPQQTLDAELIQQVCDAYQAHIALENTQLLPAATHLLSPAQLQQLGKNMAMRRGAKF